MQRIQDEGGDADDEAKQVDRDAAEAERAHAGDGEGQAEADEALGLRRARAP
jgi:hypothetical protein